jgi:uncharacterized protein (TIGR02594 family)
MKFKCKTTTALLDDAGVRKGDIFDGELVEDTGRTKAAFMEVTPLDGQTGWVLQADFEPVGAAPREPVDPATFVQECMFVERAFNNQPKIAPWFVSADMIIARAIIESGVANAGPKFVGSDATGPLQVSSEEWKAFLKNGGPLAKDFILSHFDGPYRQIRGAAYRMHADAAAISEIKTAAGAAPFVPSYLDVFHAYLTHSPKAAAAIRDAEAANAQTPLDQVLTGALKAAEIDALYAAREGLTGKRDQTKSVGEFAAAAEAGLKAALQQALDLIKQFAPEELDLTTQGEAPWYDFAEKLIGVKEPDPTILTYFDATDLTPKPTSTKTAWCGAFVAHCLANSGAVGKASIPAEAALAVRWSGWGIGLPLASKEIPVGAVIVLAPAPGTDSSGHVGFFSGFDADGKAVLLGGNQSQSVNKQTFPMAIRAIRWLDLAPDISTQQFGETASGSPISDRAFNMIVEFEVTSKARYEKRYRQPEWPGASSGVTIGIGYDVGHATKAQLQSDWNGIIPKAMITALEKAVGVKGFAAKPLAQKLGASVDISWDAAIKVHRDKVVPRWIGIVERALQPNAHTLNQNQLGALVSLTFNRGASFAKAGERYREMRAIKAHMQASQFNRIPDEIRSMVRLWPTIEGLRTRREREARLFET